MFIEIFQSPAQLEHLAAQVETVLVTTATLEGTAVSVLVVTIEMPASVEVKKMLNFNMTKLIMIFF